jgi:hypothetical protein
MTHHVAEDGLASGMRSLLLICLFCTSGLAGQEWVQLDDFPGTPRDDAAAFTVHDRVFVGTGLDEGFQLTNDWYVFILSEWRWDTIAPLPANGRQYASAFTLNGQGYVFGGVDGGGPLNELWCYDPLTDAWSERTPLPAAGRYACAVFTQGDKAYICAGMLDGGTPTNEVWMYDRTTDAWTARTAVPGPPRHRASALDNLIVGGADATGTALTDAQAYTTTTDTWTARSDLPGPRYSAEAVDNLLIGGASTASTLHADVWSYDLVTDTWSSAQLPPFPGGPRRSAVSAPNLYLMDVGMVFFGTGSDNQQRYRDWWMLTFPVGLRESDQGTLRVVPNPAQDRIIVERSVGEELRRIMLLDGRGRPVHTWDRPVGALDLPKLAPGHYLLRCEGPTQNRTLPLVIIP